MKFKTTFLIAFVLIVSAAFATPPMVKEKSPPMYEAAAPAAIISTYDMIITSYNFDEVVMNQTNHEALVMASLAINQEYASHVSEVAIAPLYRRIGSDITTQKNNDEQCNSTGELTATKYQMPEVIPKEYKFKL